MKEVAVRQRITARHFSYVGHSRTQCAITVASPTDVCKPSDCCRLLKEVGIKYIVDPTEPAYAERVQSYWSLTSQLSPACFVQPESTEEVSLAVKTLVHRTGCKFAVRSGGHSSNSGASNIDKGVTIDLGRLNGSSYNTTSEQAQLRPGSRWLDVYVMLDAMGVGVQGGGIGSVGVGGLLLDGGFSPYLYERGLATDDIQKLEVVLANGEIIEASATQNEDLYQVLKGGGGGFGIVTRYDMETFARKPIWSAYREYPEDANADEAHILGLKHWTDNPEVYDSGSAFIWWTYRPAAEQTIIISSLADTAGQAGPSAFKELLSILGYNVSSIGLTNMSTSAQATQASGYSVDPAHMCGNIWFTLSFNNDERVIRKAVELHRHLVEDMKRDSRDGDFETQAYFQPLPAIIARRGAERGGNILGLDRLKSNAVVLLGSLAVSGVDQEALGRQKMDAWRYALEEYSRERGALVDFRYMNYADASQDVLGSYGEVNVRKMLAVSRKYDPEGIFQKRVPGGFKLPRP